MKREEEMWKSVEEEHGELSRREAMVALTAMEWADETMIERACEWLFKNTYKGVDDSRVYTTFTYTVDMIEDFRKAMKGEELLKSL